MQQLQAYSCDILPLYFRITAAAALLSASSSK